jgi:hypothetical protein
VIEIRPIAVETVLTKQVEFLVVGQVYVIRHKFLR